MDDLGMLTPEQRALVMRHIPLANKLAYVRCFASEDLNDVRSDALFGLVLAARRYRPHLGGFPPYARVSIEGAIRKGRMRTSGVPRTMWEAGERTRPVSLDAPIAGTDIPRVDSLMAPEGHPDLEDAVGRLGARDRLVVRLRFWEGLTQHEVAPLLGVSQMQVSRVERRALERLRVALA